MTWSMRSTSLCITRFHDWGSEPGGSKARETKMARAVRPTRGYAKAKTSAVRPMTALTGILQARQAQVNDALDDRVGTRLHDSRATAGRQASLLAPTRRSRTSQRGGSRRHEAPWWQSQLAHSGQLFSPRQPADQRKVHGAQPGIHATFVNGQGQRDRAVFSSGLSPVLAGHPQATSVDSRR